MEIFFLKIALSEFCQTVTKLFFYVFGLHGRVSNFLMPRAEVLRYTTARLRLKGILSKPDFVTSTGENSNVEAL